MLSDSIILKLLFVKLSGVEKWCSLAKVEFVSILENRKILNGLSESPKFTFIYLFVTFACCIKLQAKVNLGTGLSAPTHVKTDIVQSLLTKSKTID